MASSTALGPIFSLCFMCTGLVEMKVWMRGFFALRSASPALSMSVSVERASVQIAMSFASSAIWLTHWKSPSEEAAKPASQMSTFISCSSSASSSFSRRVIEAPGDCSPSRIVVSKMSTRSLPVRSADGLMVGVVIGAVLSGLLVGGCLS